MKKLFALLISLALIFALAACGSTNAPVDGTEVDQDVPPVVEDTGWTTVDLVFVDSINGELKGEFSYNPDAMEWKATYDTPYGMTELGGTYTADGTLTLVDDSTGGFAANSMGPINDAVRAELTGGEVSEWVTIDLVFVDSINGELKGQFSYDAAAMAWKANYDTPYGTTELAGTYTADGTLTLVDDSTGGFAANSMGPINDAVRAALTGGAAEGEWVEKDIEFEDPMMGALTGKFSYNAAAKEWKVAYESAFGLVELGGTYNDDGTLVLVDDSTGGHAAKTVPAINDAVKADLTK